MKFRLLLVVLFLFLSPLSLAQGSDENYEVRKGDINGDGLTDLYIREKPKIVILHGDIATPIALPVSSFGYVVRQNTDKTFSFVQSPVISESAWSQTQIEVTALDFNVDGSIDFFLKGVGDLIQSQDGISGVADQLLFTNQDQLVKIRQVDSEFKQFFDEVYLWRQNPNYFVDNARYISVTKYWTEYDYLGYTASTLQVPVACNYYTRCLYEYGYILSVLYPYSRYEESKIYWLGEWYIYETRQVADYSSFNPLAVRYSKIYDEILERGEVLAGSSAATELSNILEELFGIQYMSGVLEAPGEVLPEEEDIEPARIPWFRLLRWSNVFAWTTELTGSTPRNKPIYRVVDDQELASVRSSHSFSFGPSGFEVKQFWTNIIDGDWFATEGLRDISGGAVNNHRTLLEVWVSPETISAGYRDYEPTKYGRKPWISYDAVSLPILNNDIKDKTIYERRRYEPDI